MTDDPGFYELAAKFPEAVLALLGVTTAQPYRCEAVELKLSRRLDAVLSPSEEARSLPLVELVPSTGDGTRYYVEYQARHDPDVERDLLLKVVAHCVKERWSGPAKAVVIYTEQRFRKSALRADIRSTTGLLVRFEVQRVVLRRLSPRSLSARGWPARLALPLVGEDDAVVVRGARAWLAELDAALAAAPERQAAARELFVRLVADRLPDANMYALLQGLEDVVENTATGRALIAKGRNEGRNEGLRNAILDILDARGLTVTAEVRARLDREDDPARLAAIHRASLTTGPDLSGLFAG